MYRKNVAGQYIYFALINASTGAALTGATVSAYRALDGNAQASATGTVTELANGQYRFALSQADTNADYGSYLFTATGAVPVEKTAVFTGANPTDSVRFGLSALPNAAAEAAGGLVTNGTGTGQLSVSGGNVTAGDFTAAGLAKFFTLNTTKTYGDAIAGSVVYETAENAVGTAALDAAGVRAAIGMSSANLDTQLAAIYGVIDTEVGSIKGVTDKLNVMISSVGTGDYQFDATALELAPSGGGGSTDWDSTERAQIRHRLGIDGTASAPSASPSLVTAFWNILYTTSWTANSMAARLLSQVGLIAAGAPLNLISPVTSSGELDLIQGSAYATNQGNAIKFAVDGTVTDLTGQTPTLTLKSTTSSHTLAVNGTVTGAGTTGQTIVFELTAVQTAALEPTPADPNIYTKAKPPYYYTVSFASTPPATTKPCVKRARGKVWVQEDFAACAT